MLVNTIHSWEDMKREFVKYDRDYYTNEAYEEIFNYYNDFDDNIEFDVIAICCDWNEEDEEEIRSNYSLDDDDNLERYLDNNTYYIKLNNGNYLYLVF